MTQKATQHTVNSFFSKKSPAKRQASSQIENKPKIAKISSDMKEGASFASLCKTFEAIEETSKRLIITDILTKYLLDVMQKHPDDLQSIIYLSVNRLGPTWKAQELGIGETVLMKAIGEATGQQLQKVKASLQQHGDLGLVAQLSRRNQPVMFQPKPLTIQAVFKSLTDISEFSGHSSMNKKIDKIKFLLASCRDQEAKYLIRALEGKLRIGLAEASVLVSLARATVFYHDGEESDFPVAVDQLKQVYSEVPDYELILPILLEKGIADLDQSCHMTPGIPLKPMLAHPTQAITDVLNRFDGIPFTCEYKYDGERAQIHLLPDGQYKIFSRNQENMNDKYPDIMDHMKLVPSESVKSFVLDTEAVAWDAVAKTILPFQVLSTRKRKGVATEDIKVQVCIYAFDLLYLNGKSLVRVPFKERRKLLHDNFKNIDGKFQFATYSDGSTAEEIQQFLEESIKGNCEGLMVKTIDKDSSYEPSRRSRNWLKVKKDYLQSEGGVGDSLDLVVIGAYHGKGKRVGGFGGFLLACYDKEREEYQAISKIATGFSEKDLADFTESLTPLVIDVPKSYYNYSDNVRPDVWLEPQQVWEVKCADFSISPIYSAARGLVDNSKGISLRFPRYIRIRDDKAAQECTSAVQVANMYRAQSNIAGQGLQEDEDY